MEDDLRIKKKITMRNQPKALDRPEIEKLIKLLRSEKSLNKIRKKYYTDEEDTIVIYMGESDGFPTNDQEILNLELFIPGILRREPIYERLVVEFVDCKLQYQFDPKNDFIFVATATFHAYNGDAEDIKSKIECENLWQLLDMLEFKRE